ncbi:protein often near L-alanine-DL-glutamate epimerase [alpha proteobacterium U9-1i]|nr:protein often near L-alanine-DL-glutamate epimerase [alpha proteobacterium U9-1i]
MSARQSVVEIPRPFLLFLGDCAEIGYAKTALGLRDWAPENCVGEYGFANAVSVGLKPMTPRDAKALGAQALVIGVANPGGVIPQAWVPALLDALHAGLDVAGGMHVKLNDIPELAAAARTLGRRLIDVRVPPANIPIANGKKRTGKRLLTVGTDCALGKKYTALALTRAFSARGVAADFRATGQTGIMIAGRGMPMDAVVSDFEAGAAEILSPDNDPHHWDVIEGQGSLFHPAYAGVSLGLLHGSQPDVVVLCHDPTRKFVLGHSDYPLPDLAEAIDLTIWLGKRTNPAIRCAGVAMNTSRMSEAEAINAMRSAEDALALPVADPIRGGAMFEKLVTACLSG